MSKARRRKGKKSDLPLVELYSPMYRLVKYRTTTAERKNEMLNVRNIFHQENTKAIKTMDTLYRLF